MDCPYTTFNEIPESIIESIHTMFTKDDYRRFPILGRGISGVVYDIAGYAVKVGYITPDSSFLPMLNGINLFPKVYAYYDSKYPRGYIVMEKINGMELSMATKMSIKHNWYISLAKDLALATQRRVGIGDVHSGNIMITYDGDIKLVDAGAYYTIKGCQNNNEAGSLIIDNVHRYINNIKYPQSKEMVV